MLARHSIIYWATLCLLLVVTGLLAPLPILWAFSSPLASEPAIEFTYVPPYCSSEDLKGQVWNVNPLAYKVCVYIYAGGWWTKPYFDYPDTPIDDSGNWKCDITTGGIDETATRIAAFLTPKENGCKLMSGQQKLAQEIYDNSVASAEIEREMLRVITFSGLDWEVKASCGKMAGPGPNYFSDREEDVWVDEADQLHLKVTKRDGKWYCTEVFTEASLGYGKYIFHVGSRVDQLDKNIVLGLFTWDERAPEYNYREIDIEFSRWGGEAGDNAQYVVQPWDYPGNIHKFNIELEDQDTTHIFSWGPASLFFQSLYGHYSPSPDEEYIIESWPYTGNDIPPAGQENARINLWLYNGNPPSDAEEAEIVIKAFEFIPWCEGDLDADGDVDGSDLALFAADFGRTDCCEPDVPPCEGDFDGDCDVDGSDLAVFAADFGRTDCPYALPIPMR